MRRITLSKGVNSTPLNGLPSNGKFSRAITTKPWYISYRFCWNGTKILVQVKSLNESSTAAERKIATEILLDYEMTGY
jgi:hypothetical protein